MTTRQQLDADLDAAYSRKAQLDRRLDALGIRRISTATRKRTTRRPGIAHGEPGTIRRLLSGPITIR